MERSRYWAESVGTRMPRRERHPARRVYLSGSSNRLAIEFSDRDRKGKPEKVVRVTTPNAHFTKQRLFPANRQGIREMRAHLSNNNLPPFRFAGHRVRAVRLAK